MKIGSNHGGNDKFKVMQMQLSTCDARRLRNNNLVSKDIPLYKRGGMKNKTDEETTDINNDNLWAIIRIKSIKVT